MIGGGRRAHDPRKFGLYASPLAPDCFLSPASASLSCSSFLFKSVTERWSPTRGKLFPRGCYLFIITTTTTTTTFTTTTTTTTKKVNGKAAEGKGDLARPRGVADCLGKTQLSSYWGRDPLVRITSPGI